MMIIKTRQRRKPWKHTILNTREGIILYHSPKTKKIMIILPANDNRSEDFLAWECSECGNIEFYILPYGFMCIECEQFEEY